MHNFGFVLFIYIFCQSNADAVESEKTIVLHGGYPTLYEVEPAVKTY